METTARCKCGVTIDIAGATPRPDGIKLWCRVCGDNFVHKRES